MESANKEKFALAMGWINVGGHVDDSYTNEELIDESGLSDEDITESTDSIESFMKTWGKPWEVEETPHGTIYQWIGIQRAKGLMRGDLSVMHIGEKRYSEFTGE